MRGPWWKSASFLRACGLVAVFIGIVFRINGYRVCTGKESAALRRLSQASIVDLRNKAPFEDRFANVPAELQDSGKLLVIQGVDTSSSVFDLLDDVSCVMKVGTAQNSATVTTTFAEMKKAQQVLETIADTFGFTGTPYDELSDAFRRHFEKTRTENDAAKKDVEKLEAIKRLFAFRDEEMDHFVQAATSSVVGLPKYLETVFECSMPKTCAQEAYGRMYRVFYEKEILPFGHPWRDEPLGFDHWYDRSEIAPFMERVAKSGRVTGPVCMEHDGTVLYMIKYFREACRDAVELFWEGDRSKWKNEMRSGKVYADINYLTEVIPAGSLDLFVTTHAYQYFTDPRECMRQIFRALRPGGVLIFTAPFMAQRELDDFGEDKWRFTEEGVKRLLKDAGFIWEEVTPVGKQMTTLGFLQGMSVKYFDPKDLEATDIQWFNIVVALAIKPGTPPALPAPAS